MEERGCIPDWMTILHNTRVNRIEDKWHMLVIQVGWMVRYRVLIGVQIESLAMDAILLYAPRILNEKTGCVSSLLRRTVLLSSFVIIVLCNDGGW